MSEGALARHLLAQIDKVRARLTGVTPDALFDALGLRRIDEAPPSGQDGLYVREFEAVFLNPNIRIEERRLFTSFHEGTHAIVDRDPVLREQLRELCPDEAFENRVVELLCNIGAAEFLMPRSRFVPILRAQGSAVECVQSIEREFRGASLPAIAQQIAHYAAPPGLVLICTHASIPGSSGSERARTHVQYSFVPPVSGATRVRPRPKRYQVIRDDHPLSAIFDRPRPFSGATYYPYASDKRIPCWCEAVWHVTSGRVVALLSEKRPRSGGSEQRTLPFED